MVENETMTMLSQVFGMGGRYVAAEEVIAEMRASPREARAQKVLNMLLTAPLGNHQAENIMGRFRFVEHDVAQRGDATPFDWMLNEDEKRRLSPNIDDLLGVTSLLIPQLSFKGYGDWDGVRSREGGAVSPATMAMMEIWGPRKLKISIRNGGGVIASERLTLSMAKMIGELAYTQAGIKAFNARDSDKYGGVLMEVLGRAVAKGINRPNLMSDNPAIRAAAQADVLVTDILTQNGEPPRGWSHLLEVLSAMPFIAEGFINVNADQMEMAQHVYGGFANEKARGTWGSLYFIDEGQLNHQMGPEVHLLSAFGGLLSQYAAKGGLNWMFDDSRWVGVPGGFAGTPIAVERGPGNLGLRSRFIKEVMTYQPRQGEADLIEARMLKRFIDGEDLTPENVQTALERVPKSGRTHLRPPELWVPKARMLLRSNPQYAAAWAAADADVSVWARKVEMNLVNTQGHAGLMEYLTKAAERGVGLYEWNNFNARMVGDEMRYANKVEVTSECFRQASNKMAQAGTAFAEKDYRKRQKVTIISALQTTGNHAAVEAVEIIKKGEKDLLKWMSSDLQESFVVAWVKGVVRANFVPFFTDNTTLMFDFDESDFVGSEGVVVKPKKFWRKDVEAELVASGRSVVELETFMAENGMRWSIYRNSSGSHDNEQFVVNSSGRPAYRAATALELYNKAGAVLLQMEGHMAHLDMEVQDRLKKFRATHNAIRSKGWNRFSMNWWVGGLPVSVDSIKVLIRFLQNGELISEGDAVHLVDWASSLGQPKDERIIALGKPKGLNRPLGSERDSSIGLPDPRWMKPDEVKVDYQAFSGNVH